MQGIFRFCGLGKNALPFGAVCQCNAIAFMSRAFFKGEGVPNIAFAAKVRTRVMGRCGFLREMPRDLRGVPLPSRVPASRFPHCRSPGDAGNWVIR